MGPYQTPHNFPISKIDLRAGSRPKRPPGGGCETPREKYGRFFEVGLRAIALSPARKKGKLKVAVSTA